MDGLDGVYSCGRVERADTQPNQPDGAQFQETERLQQWSLKARANHTMDQERFHFLTFALDPLHQAVERRRYRIRERAMAPAPEATN